MNPFRKSSIGLALGLSLLLAACGQVNDLDRDTSGTGQTTLRAAERFSMPAATDNSVIRLQNAGEGNYKLASFNILLVDERNGTQARVFKSAKTAGTISDDDVTEFSADWGKFTGIGGHQQMEFASNIPFQIGINKDKNIEYRERRYFWFRVENDNSWRWRASGKESPAGLRILDLFANKDSERENNRYERNDLATFEKPRSPSGIKGKGVVKPNPQGFSLFTEAKTPDGYLYLIQINYLRQ